MVSKKLLVEEKLRMDMMEIYLESILNGSSDIFYWLDKDSRILACNENQAKYFGYSSISDVIGKTTHEIVENLGMDKRFVDIIRENDLEVLRTEKPIRIEETLKFNGVARTCLSSKNPFRDRNGEIIGIFGISIDVTNTTQRKSALPFNLISYSAFQDKLKENLTTREQDCVFLLLRGNTTKNIAKKLQISPRTVETHLINIKSKLGCYSKAELIETILNKLDLDVIK